MCPMGTWMTIYMVNAIEPVGGNSRLICQLRSLRFLYKITAVLKTTILKFR